MAMNCHAPKKIYMPHLSEHSMFRNAAHDKDNRCIVGECCEALCMSCSIVASNMYQHKGHWVSHRQESTSATDRYTSTIMLIRMEPGKLSTGADAAKEAEVMAEHTRMS